MIKIEVNNEQYITLRQEKSTMLFQIEPEGEERSIPASDMVMLLNLYWHTKRNNIQNEFINPNGIKP